MFYFFGEEKCLLRRTFRKESLLTTMSKIIRSKIRCIGKKVFALCYGAGEKITSKS
jgi:hypothetical protein